MVWSGLYFKSLFLSTLSLRRATSLAFGVFLTCIFLSTLSLRRATMQEIAQQRKQRISIHALLAESDRVLATYWTRTVYFYPRSPCGERHRYGRPIDVQLVFLSTLSLRRATGNVAVELPTWKFLSTLSLRRATQVQSLKVAALSISIHALLAESDSKSAQNSGAL